jgi:two-component system chemotaxis sensor kinase CheA
MVEEKVREIRDILDNIGQGLFTVSYDGRVNPDYASTTNFLLGVDDVARCSVEALFRLDEAGSNEWKEWLELARMRQERMPWTQIARLCPVRELRIEGKGVRHIQIAFQPMRDRQGRPSNLMVLVQDVTESRRIEALIRSEKEKHEEEVRAILGIVNNAALVPEFLRDVEARRERLLSVCRRWRAEKPQAEDLAAVLRDLHTLKGSASTYGFVPLERAARKAELAAAGLRASADPRPGEAEALFGLLEGELVPAVEAAKGMARRLSGLGEDASVPIPERKVRELQALVGRLPDDIPIVRARLAELLAACRSLDHVRLSIPGERYRAMLSRLAARLGKAVEFRVRPEAMEISPRTLAALDEPLVHVFRNALDHGLETRAERAACGKSEAGRIEFSLEREGGGLVMRIEDDGKGIDADRVAQRAVAMGAVRAEQAAAMTEAEKAGLILLPGLTTRERSDDLSGLGVGMDAVAAWAISLGGRVDVATSRGQGTCITIRLPKEPLA